VLARKTGAISYDVAGVELGHHGEECSFDAIVKKYNVRDEAVGRLALIVRGADTPRRDLTPESPGLEAINGASSTRSHRASCESSQGWITGRTRWAIYDAAGEMFFVNVASPARIIAIDARDPTKILKEYEVPAAGPHGLELDPATGRLLCACDAGLLLAIEAASGDVLADVPLSGPPTSFSCIRNLGISTWP
jgi:hypothetical protein